MEAKCNEINWHIVEKDRKQISSLVEGVRRVNMMEHVPMTCANICGVQHQIVDVAAAIPLLYQFAWRLIRFIEKRETITWMHDNINLLAHLPMVFMAKIHQFFMHLASFSQNLININMIKVEDNKFETKIVTTTVKLASKILNKIQQHIDNNSIPKDIPLFTKSFFVKATRRGFTLAPKAEDTKKGAATQPPKGASDKPKPTGNEGKKKQKKEFSNKSLKMGLFQVKKGTPITISLPDKSLLKDSLGVCMNFCCHEKKVQLFHVLCKNGKHYTNWKNILDEDKIILLKHMDSTSLLWLDTATFEKHKITIPPSTFTSLATQLVQGKKKKCR